MGVQSLSRLWVGVLGCYSPSPGCGFGFSLPVVGAIVWAVPRRITSMVPVIVDGWIRYPVVLVPTCVWVVVSPVLWG